MRTIIEDTWFPASTKICVGKGADELSFLRCTFEGGEIFIEPNVEGTIFLHCVFQHTRFSGQRLSERIAVGCRNAFVNTEAAAATRNPQHGKFRR